MKEENRDQLKAAIEQLPDYQAGPEIWDRLEAALDQEKTAQDNEIKMQVSTALLPTYEAPQSVWNRLEKQLGGKRRPLWLGRIAAAVVVLAAIGGLAVWQRPEAGPPPPIAEQSNQQSSLDLPVAESIEMSVLREQQAELLNCLEQHPDWESIQTGETFINLQALVAADSLVDEAGLAERQNQTEEIVAALKSQYCE
ncbi:MAG: hypothetical protein AAF927_26705 [Bacteroidota bacterium]